MESQKRPRSEHNDTSVSKTFPQIAIPIRSETKVAIKLLLSERKKKAKRVEMKKFDEIQFLEELKKRLAKIDENLHCEVEIISGHPSSGVLCVFPSREKSFNDTIGLLQLTITWYKMRHAGGQAHCYSRTGPLKQRDLSQ